MKISIEQVQKALEQPPAGTRVDAAVIRLIDRDLVSRVVAQVEATPDREEMIEDLRLQIQAGTYRPSGEDIADAMIRRTLADRIGME